MKTKSKNIIDTQIETSLIILIILCQFKNKLIDLDTLTYLEHLILHSGDADGPSNIFADSPFRNIEHSIKKDLISKSLLHLIDRDLVTIHFKSNGIFYSSNLISFLFLEKFQSEMYIELTERANWLEKQFSNYKLDDFKNHFKHNLANNTEELIKLGFTGGNE